mgnify:CR=1 FL=1
MPRNRIIYQSEALYAGPSPATDIHFTGNASLPKNTWYTSGDLNLVKQLQRVQSANYSFTVNRTDVNQFGQLAAIDRVILNAPTVSLDFSYLLANFANENNLGFTVASGSADVTSALSGFLTKSTDERNYFIKTTAEGTDAVNNSATGVGVIGIGNGFITSYTAEGSVGNFPTVSVNVEALNMNFQQQNSGNNVPAIFPDSGVPVDYIKFALPTTVSNTAGDASASGISTLRPGDVTLSLPGIFGASGQHVQKYNVSFDLARTPIERLGSKFPFSREIDFPVTVNMTVEGIMTDTVTGSLSSLISDDSTKYNPSVTIYTPTGVGTTRPIIAKYEVRGAKLDSQEFSSDIGGNKTVTWKFSSQIGGPQDTNNGLFLSGKA